MKSFALALLVASTSAAWAGTSEKAAQAACDTWKALDGNKDKKAGDADYDAQCVTNVAAAKETDKLACGVLKIANTDSSSDAYKAVCPASDGATNVTAFAATMAAAIAALAFWAVNESESPGTFKWQQRRQQLLLSSFENCICWLLLQHISNCQRQKKTETVSNYYCSYLSTFKFSEKKQI
jgi:hypothetical protein